MSRWYTAAVGKKFAGWFKALGYGKQTALVAGTLVGTLTFPPLALLAAGVAAWPLACALAVDAARAPFLLASSDARTRRRSAAYARYHQAVRTVDRSPLDDLEKRAARERARQQFLRDLDEVIRHDDAVQRLPGGGHPQGEVGGHGPGHPHVGGGHGPG